MSSHVDLATLAGYWLGELDDALEAQVEQHYLGCEECSGRLGELDALAAGMRRAVGSGQVHAVLTPALAERLRAAGLRLREYDVPRNGSVNCTVAPEDDLLLSRLHAPLDGISRLDAIVEGVVRLEDIPFDPAAGEVVIAPRMGRVRAMPACTEVVRLVAVEAGGERVVGEYTFHHTPARR